MPQVKKGEQRHVWVDFVYDRGYFNWGHRPLSTEQGK
jgi:hypothetical protein